jgi:SAM-dependent methyltransferase
MSLNHTKTYNLEIRDWLEDVFKLTSQISRTALVSRVCPVCQSPKSALFGNNDYLDYVRCEDCSLVYMNPAPSPSQVNSGFKGEDEVLMKYFNIITKYKKDIPPKPDPEKDNKLRDIYQLKKTGKLLDLGCSVGDFLHKAKHFYDVEGLEINPNTSALAEKHFKIHKAFLSELNLKPEYDIVTMHQILYGVPDPLKLLQEIHAILKGDGLLYINTPNSNSYAMELYKGKANHIYGYTSLNVFNRKSLETVACKAGFKVKTYRTEWLDIYLSDVQEFLENREKFVQKRNCHIANYEEKIALEDKLHAEVFTDLGDRGNYVVAVLEKL